MAQTPISIAFSPMGFRDRPVPASGNSSLAGCRSRPMVVMAFATVAWVLGVVHASHHISVATPGTAVPGCNRISSDGEPRPLMSYPTTTTEAQIACSITAVGRFIAPYVAFPPFFCSLSLPLSLHSHTHTDTREHAHIAKE